MPPCETPAEQPTSPAATRERFFLEHLDLIRRVAAAVAKRRRLSADEAEEFTSDVLFRLIRNDYAVLSKFRGQSSLAAFLKPVIDRMCLDMRVANWGKWRPSSRSRRLGAIAVTLERLTLREGLTFEEACTTLEINHRLRIDRKALGTIQAGARDGGRRRPVSDEAIANRHAPDAAPDDEVFATEDCRLLANAARTLATLVRALPSEDRCLLQRLYRDGRSVAAIARELPCDQKSLYRRFDHLRGQLRAGLEAAGIEADVVLPLVGQRDIMPAGVFDLTPQPSVPPAAEAPVSEPPMVAERVAFSHRSTSGSPSIASDLGSSFA